MAPYARPSWDDYFLEMTKLTAARATCPRRRVGALLVQPDRKSVIASGYNGAVRGQAHCDDVGCLMVDGHCVRAVHAELNALIQCAVYGVPCEGATLYVTDFPCVHCAKALIQAGVRKIVYLAPYPDKHAKDILVEGGISLFQAVPQQQGYQLVADA